jgi:TatD DNase family protein
MTYIDTHTHIYLEQFDADRAEAIDRALKMGVKQLIMPNVDAETIDAMMKVYRDFPGVCLPMMGLHPTSVKKGFEEELKKVEDWLASERFYAIGETGIDLYWDKTWLEEQKLSLHRHAELALYYDLPLVVHARKSLNEIFQVLKSFKGSGLRGVFHCFPGSIQDAARVVDMGFLMGIGGVVTYKNSSMAKVVEAFEMEHFVLETDAPYLPPVPHRGKRNESAYIPDIARKIADIKCISAEKVADATTENAKKLFGL